MTDIHETAYPRLKSQFSSSDLENFYTPTEQERQFAREQRRQPVGQFTFLVLLKTTQRLGYFLTLSEIPGDIKQHIAKSVEHYTFKASKLKEYDTSGARQRFLKVLRTHLDIKAFDEQAQGIIELATLSGAETKQAIPDIINIAIEELVRQRYELPGFHRLLKTAQKSRKTVNDAYLKSITQALSKAQRTELDDLLGKSEGQHLSGWLQVKQEPKKPNNRAIREHLQHLQWLQSWVERLPGIDHLPVTKKSQFIWEARALDANDLRQMRPQKRHALMVVFIHSQLFRATDDTLTILIRRVLNLHSSAEERLRQYQLDQAKRTDRLITQFRDVLTQFQTDDAQILSKQHLIDILGSEPQTVITECEEHIAYADNNYYPFMLSSYQQIRPLLLNCLALVELRSTTNDQSLLDAIAFIQAHRHSHKEWLPIAANSVWKQKLNLDWLSEKWRKLVTGKSTKSAASTVHRKYFELCVLTQVVWELKTADLIAEHANEYNDHTLQYISWDDYEEQLPAYNAMLDFPETPSAFVQSLKQQLNEAANQLDRSYPDNDCLSIISDGLILHRGAAKTTSQYLRYVDEELSKRMETRNILDVLIEAEGWLDLHKKFGPISGFEGKINDPRKRFIASLFCYGCNLGPSQTAQSIKELSRKQVAWLNVHHVTEERLDKAIERVVNAYNRFRLPSYWGTGKSASADGTMWNLYEQNLISEHHIRYGGYGGIGYYHVSDTYIALFSHFIPCGVYEAVYILDGIIKNESDIQPDTLHGDTQAQSTTVFGLAYLLGIELMPRIRNIKDLVFYKPDKKTRYKHINSLFKESINWKLIETHLPDMLRIALSIKAGTVAPSTILRRLGTYNRKNKIYFAFRELGRVVRTQFLLKYIGDMELRQTIQAATCKSEEFNQFTKWLFFGGDGIIAENVRHEQNKIIKYNQLVANLVILYNVDEMTKVLRQLQEEGVEITAEILAGLSPYRTKGINRLGDYSLDVDPSLYQPDYSADFFH